MSVTNHDFGSVILEQAPCPVARIDRDRRVVEANAAFRRMFGDGLGEPCYRICRAQDAPCEDCVATEAFANGEVRDALVRVTGQDGRSVQLDVRAVPVSGGEGEVSGVGLVMTHASHVAELEERLRLADRLASVGLSAGGLAHSIKNVLGGLEGAIYTLDSGLDQEDLGLTASSWEVVRRYLDQVGALVRNLLDYARDQEPHRETLAPGSLVERILELFEDKGTLVGVHVQAHVEDGLPRIHVDPQAIEACLSNLVTNAMDACLWDPDTDKEHRIDVRVRQGSGGGVVYEVSDNGPGIAPQNQDRILVSAFSTKGLRGTGLGLLLTRKAVEQHGGTVGFESTPGQGTTFRVDLPAEG